jgi:hypothetical protein
MMKAKSTRNQKILALFKIDTPIADIARKYRLSWPRTQRIIKQELAREAA